MRALFLAALLAACATAQPAPEYVGTATIDEAGVLTLQLVSRDHGMIAHGLAVYRPGDAHYDEVLRHVGPIRPGETKPVRAWPD